MHSFSLLSPKSEPEISPRSSALPIAESLSRKERLRRAFTPRRLSVNLSRDSHSPNAPPHRDGETHSLSPIPSSRAQSQELGRLMPSPLNNRSLSSDNASPPEGCINLLIATYFISDISAVKLIPIPLLRIQYPVPTVFVLNKSHSTGRSNSYS